MPLGFTKNTSSPIAIDFGADSLKLLQVVPSDPPQLLAAAAMPVPPEARSEPAARHAFFLNALKSLLRKQPFRGKRAVCSIPAYQTLVQQVQITRTEQDDVELQIGLMLRQRLNVDPARMVVRHVPVAQVVRDGVAKQEFVCIAASRDAVMRHIETVHRAGLDVVGMHAEPLAILKAFASMYQGEEGAARTTCFIDIGAATTKLVVAHGSELAFAKSIHSAGDHLNRQFAQARNMDLAQARALRIREAAGPETTATPSPAARAAAKPSLPSVGGLAVIQAQMAADPEEAGSRPRPRPVDPAALTAQQPAGDAIDCLIDEAQLCLRYHQTLFPGRAIEKLVFLGGESLNRTTCQAIARALRIGAQLGDPLARVPKITQSKQPTGVDLNQPQPAWAVPLGLCLSEAA